MKFEQSVYTFLKELEQFDYTLSSIDHVWNIVFLDEKGTWKHIHINKYRETFYISHIDGNTCALEVSPKKSVKAAESFGFSSYDDGRYDPAGVWEPMIEAARRWLKTVEKDWIAANRRVHAEYPLNRRFGVVPAALVTSSLEDTDRFDKALGAAKSRTFIRLVEEGWFHNEENTTVESMSAADYFEYCRLAYIAAKRKEDRLEVNQSGREMYQRHADGRHEGLLDIDENSPQEFADWIDGKHSKKTTGGHPWEIKRGGNTTHIDLSVYRPLYSKKGFKIELRGASCTRLVETVQMFLAIHEAKRPVSISEPEGVRMRLLGQDNIGIIPCYDTLHRANQHFGQDQHVYDVMHYDDLGRYKRRVAPFVSWEPLPVLRLRSL